MGKAYDPKVVQAQSDWAVQYVVNTSGEPLFRTAYARDGSGNASQEPAALAVNADVDRMAELIAPDGVELDGTNNL